MSLGPHAERQRLCLQLVLHAQLHNFSMPLNEQTVDELCAQLGLQNVPATHVGRVAALQALAPQLLPQMS